VATFDSKEPEAPIRFQIACIRGWTSSLSNDVPMLVDSVFETESCPKGRSSFNGIAYGRLQTNVIAISTLPEGKIFALGLASVK